MVKGTLVGRSLQFCALANPQSVGKHARLVPGLTAMALAGRRPADYTFMRIGFKSAPGPPGLKFTGSSSAAPPGRRSRDGCRSFKVVWPSCSRRRFQ